MSNRETIVPPNWQVMWSDEQVTFLEPLLDEIQIEFEHYDHTAHFQLWRPGTTTNGAFISLGVSGGGHGALLAFGFYYEDAVCWPEDYIEKLVERCVSEYARFHNGDWPIGEVHDDFSAERQTDEVPTDMWGEEIIFSEEISEAEYTPLVKDDPWDFSEEEDCLS